jgi:peptide/nickel transport system permease protein
MGSYIIRRIVYMLVLLVLLSMVSFFIIELPPGNYLDTYVQSLINRGIDDVVAQQELEVLVKHYGLDKPAYTRYLKWFGNLLKGDMGQSLIYAQGVGKLISERIALTFIISLLSLLFTYALAIPIGIYSATHQYSILDYIVTFFGFIGLAIPNFLLALILMYLSFKYLNWNIGGLFSPEYVISGWSFGKVIDLLKHLPIPIFVVGTSGTAGMIRVMRGTLLDELPKQYVITARAKGLKERKLLMKYPVRVALNPIVSSIGGVLPALISGATLTAMVMSLPTVGPLLLEALKAQDMYMAGSLLMLLSSLGLIGVLISDILLVVVDPRIRFEAKK